MHRSRMVMVLKNDTLYLLIMLLFHFHITAGVNIIFFLGRKICPVETMVRRTRRISERTSEKTLF